MYFFPFSDKVIYGIEKPFKILIKGHSININHSNILIVKDDVKVDYKENETVIYFKTPNYNEKIKLVISKKLNFD